MLGKSERRRIHGLILATLLHSGGSDGVLGGTPDTYHTAGLKRGTATSSSTRPGTTSRVLSDPASTLGGCRQGSSHRTRARPADQLTSGRSGGTNMATLQDSVVAIDLAKTLYKAY